MLVILLNYLYILITHKFMDLYFYCANNINMVAGSMSQQSIFVSYYVYFGYVKPKHIHSILYCVKYGINFSNLQLFKSLASIIYKQIFVSNT